MNRRDPLPKPLVLVVDDDPTLRLMLGATLETIGMQTIEAEDGESGIALFKSRAPELVLLDVVMPKIDGFAACRAMRESAQGGTTPIVMMTGLDDTDSVNNAYDAGATDFISKPVNWAMLGHRLRYILRTSRAMAKLATSQSHLAKSQRVARLGSFEWDVGTDELVRSDEVLRILGLTEDTFPEEPRELLRFVVDDERARVGRAVEQTIFEGKPVELDFRIRPAGGATSAVRVLLDPERYGPGPAIRMHGIVQDVTERKRDEDRIRYLAYVDGITELPNRSWLRERLAAVIDNGRVRKGRVAALFIDLDHFKRVNDSRGHGIGDRLLGEVARRLRHTLRARDLVARAGVGSPVDIAGDNEASIARLGGDEFCIVLESLDRRDDAVAVAQRVLEMLRKPFVIEGFEMFISASIGIAIFPDDGRDADSLLKSADTAMNHAKEEGRGNYQFFERALSSRALERLTIENELRRALERDQLLLHYQPQVESASGTVVGVEALVRWQHPRFGLALPSRFIDIAEDSRLIIPIGEWVLRRACADAKRWQREGAAPIPVAVNVSGRHFDQPNFISAVTAALDASGLPPSCMKVEITEHVLMQDLEATLASLRTLKSMGIELAIDDFGTGYSSLAYLKRFPIDELKIDRSFVRDITSSRDDAAITSAIIAMATKLELDLVAEGVETLEQLDMLTRFGCPVTQGFLWSRPVALAELMSALQRGRIDVPRPSQALIAVN